MAAVNVFRLEDVLREIRNEAQDCGTDRRRSKVGSGDGELIEWTSLKKRGKHKKSSHSVADI